jgi:hypothetical protein
MVTGSRSFFFPEVDNVTAFNKTIISGKRLGLGDIKSKFSTEFSLLEVNNIGKTNPQCRGHVAMIIIDGSWRLLWFLWWLVLEESPKLHIML